VRQIGYQRARRLTLFYVDPPYSIGSKDWLREREREREIFRYILLLSIVYIYIERESECVRLGISYQRARRLTLFYVDSPYSIGSKDWLRERERERDFQNIFCCCI
jgi:hypothetical protein